MAYGRHSINYYIAVCQQRFDRSPRNFVGWHTLTPLSRSLVKIWNFRLLCTNTKMWPIATDRQAWYICLCVCVSVCLSVTFVSPTKTAESIEMLFVGLTRVGRSRNHVLDGINIVPWKGAILGICSAHWKALSFGSLWCGVHSRR